MSTPVNEHCTRALACLIRSASVAVQHMFDPDSNHNKDEQKRSSSEGVLFEFNLNSSMGIITKIISDQTEHMIYKLSTLYYNTWLWPCMDPNVRHLRRHTKESNRLFASSGCLP